MEILLNHVNIIIPSYYISTDRAERWKGSTECTHCKVPFEMVVTGLFFFFSSISIFDEWRDAGSRTSKDMLKIDLFGEGLEHALSNSITWSHHMMVF